MFPQIKGYKMKLIRVQALFPISLFLTSASPDKAAHFHFSASLQKQPDVVQTGLSSQRFITAQIQVISK